MSYYATGPYGVRRVRTVLTEEPEPSAPSIAIRAGGLP